MKLLSTFEINYAPEKTRPFVSFKQNLERPEAATGGVL